MGELFQGISSEPDFRQISKDICGEQVLCGFAAADEASAFAFN